VFDFPWQLNYLPVTPRFPKFPSVVGWLQAYDFPA
jgi:hypothetical protein